MNPDAMIDTLKAQCFKCKPDDVTDAQMAAFISIANAMDINPLQPGMLYAYPIQGGGIVPMLGPDGVYKKLSEHKEVESWETEVFPTDVTLAPTHAVTKIFRVGREKPLSFTALLSEWKTESNPNWKTRPRHMLGLRSLKQCARQIIHGIPFDEDERKSMEEVNVTHSVMTETGVVVKAESRPKVERSRKGAAAALETPAPADPAATARQADIAQASAAAVDAEIIAPETKAEPPKAAEPAKTVKPAAVPLSPIKTIGDKESVTVVCEVVSFIARDFGTPAKPATEAIPATDTTPAQPAKPAQPARVNPAVKATLRGEYEGDVFDQTVKMGADGKIAHSSAWQCERPIKVTLLGKVRPNKTIGVTVTAIEVLEDELPT